PKRQEEAGSEARQRCAHVSHGEGAVPVGGPQGAAGDAQRPRARDRHRGPRRQNAGHRRPAGGCRVMAR
ncbi:unnamed protein product, partial [Ectocarpus sp. 12 AP-2014]